MFNGLEITQVAVHPLKNKQPDNALEAFARVVLNDQFVINSIRVVQGKYGLFISFPREFNAAEKKGYNLCFPLSKELRDHISERVLEEFALAAV